MLDHVYTIVCVSPPQPPPGHNMSYDPLGGGPDAMLDSLTQQLREAEVRRAEAERAHQVCHVSTAKAKIRSKNTNTPTVTEQQNNQQICQTTTNNCIIFEIFLSCTIVYCIIYLCLLCVCISIQPSLEWLCMLYMWI